MKTSIHTLQLIKVQTMAAAGNSITLRGPNLFMIPSRVLYNVAKYYVCHAFLFLEKRIITMSKSYHQMRDGCSEILLDETLKKKCTTYSDIGRGTIAECGADLGRPLSKELTNRSCT